MITLASDMMFCCCKHRDEENDEDGNNDSHSRHYHREASVLLCLHFGEAAEAATLCHEPAAYLIMCSSSQRRPL